MATEFASGNGFDITAVRRAFPFLNAKNAEKPTCFLDSSASAQKPAAVLDVMQNLYQHSYANIHRGLYRQSAELTTLYEAVRGKVDCFLHGWGESSVVFTRNTTEAINLVAHSWGWTNLQAGDEIILTTHEHHANIVPWQMLAAETGAIIKVIPLAADLTLDLTTLPALLTPRTKLVAFTQASNALGIINPAAEIVQQVRNFNADIRILIDGSQSVVHMPVDIQQLDPDFFVFTGHKLYGPTGAGALIAKPELLADMPPYQGGGDMIETVSFAGTTYKSGPARFEAGTPDFMAVIGLGAAIDFVTSIGMDTIFQREQVLHDYALNALRQVPGITLYGDKAPHRAAIFSFAVQGCHPSDVGMILAQQDIAVRVGHHCCQPLMQELGIEGTLRASAGIYTTEAEFDRLVAGLNKALKLLA